MYQIGVGGAFINVIQFLYASNILHVKVGNNNILNAIDSSIEVKQGDNLSPYFFYTFLNDVVDIFDKDLCDPVQPGSTPFNCLLYADDVVLLSQSAQGLHHCLNLFGS